MRLVFHAGRTRRLGRAHENKIGPPHDFPAVFGVLQIAAPVVDTVVHDHWRRLVERGPHIGSEFKQTPDQIGADKAGRPGNENVPIFKHGYSLHGGGTARRGRGFYSTTK